MSFRVIQNRKYFKTDTYIETFLPRRVPDIELEFSLVEFEAFELEVNADGSDVVVVEDVVNEPDQ